MKALEGKINQKESRKVRHLNALLFVIITSTLCYASDNTASVDSEDINKQGIGFSLETIINFDPFGDNNGGKIYFPIKYGKKSHFEPYIGVIHIHQSQDDYQGSEEWQDYRSYVLGVGWFAVKKIRRIDWLLGLRLEKRWVRRDSNSGWVVDNNKMSSLFLYPTLAAEYFFEGGFSIGGEANLQNGKTVGSTDEYSYSRQSTKTMIMLRYYFK